MKKLAVNFIITNNFGYIYDTLKSLYDTTSIPLDVHIVINAGAPEQVEKLRAAYPDAEYHVNQTLLGFAANHNQTMRRVENPYIALLNDDITFYPGTLDNIVTYLDEHPDVGMVGPYIEYADGTPHLSAFNDPTLPRMLYRVSGLNNLTPHGGIVRRILGRLGIIQRMGVASLQTERTTRDVPVIIGVAMVARREACLQAGLMDEFTKLYGEEFGWMLRIRRAGWRVVLLADARVRHYQTKGEKIRGWKLAEHRKGMLAYFLTYKPHWQAIILRLSLIAIHSLWTVLNLPFNRQQAKDHWAVVRMALTFRNV